MWRLLRTAPSSPAKLPTVPVLRPPPPGPVGRLGRLGPWPQLPELGVGSSAAGGRTVGLDGWHPWAEKPVITTKKTSCMEGSIPFITSYQQLQLVKGLDCVQSNMAGESRCHRELSLRTEVADFPVTIDYQRIYEFTGGHNNILWSTQWVPASCHIRVSTDHLARLKWKFWNFEYQEKNLPSIYCTNYSSY